MGVVCPGKAVAGAHQGMRRDYRGISGHFVACRALFRGVYFVFMNILCAGEGVVAVVG